MSSLYRRLSRMSLRKRFIFSAWCCEHLFREFGDYLSKRVGEEIRNEFRNFLEYFWKCLIDNKPIDTQKLNIAKNVWFNIMEEEWDEEDIEEGEEFQDYGVTEF